MILLLDILLFQTVDFQVIDPMILPSHLLPILIKIMYNTNTFTLKSFIVFLVLGHTLWLSAQRTTEGYQTKKCGNETTITYGNGTIIMEGTRAVNYSFEILNNKRQTIFECEENCGNSQEISELPAGWYRVIIRNEKGRRICRKWVKLKRPPCLAKAGKLEAIGSSQIEMRNGMATLQAIFTQDPTIPTGFIKIHLLTYGEDFNIIALDTTPLFSVNEVGNYRIQTLIIEPTSLNLEEFTGEEISIFLLKSFLKGNKNNFCSALDAKGARFRVRIPNDQVDTGSGSGVGSSIVMCNSIRLLKEGNQLTISSEEADPYFFKVNDKENHLTSVFICRDDCEEEEIVLNLANSTYLVSVYNRRGRKICKETIEIAVSDNEEEASLAGRSQTHFSFSAHRAQRTVALEWLTNTGYKVSHFELEHSLNGMDFNKIGDFVNEDWSNEMAYHETVDKTPALGTNYYRLKQVYDDDNFKYSSIQKVDFSIDLEKVAVYPNPAKEVLFVNLKNYQDAKGQLALTNQFGQLIQQIDIAAIQQDEITINTSNVKNGVYYLNIQIDGYRVLSEKILIQRFY